MKHLHLACLLAGLLGAGASAQAADMADREAGLLLGGGYVDGDMTGDGADRIHPILGARYSQRLGIDTNFFGDLTYTLADGKRANVNDGSLLNLRGGIEWLFSKQDRYDWFVAGGLGLVNVQTDDGPDFTRPLASLGVGQAWEVGVNDALRWEVRVDQSWGNDDLPNRTGNSGLSNVQALVGYSWGLGAAPDADADGVPNRLDQCPSTPRGARVDAKGCPLDGDNDGIFDGLDQCPDTPAGVKVDGKGCPLDGDGDGIADYKDKCPAVPAPGTPDGCPLDSDGDGIVDAQDKCPTVAAPGTVDGCPPPAPAPAPVAAPKKLTLEGVNFDNDSAALRPESMAILDAAAASLKEWGEVKVEVAGHTDSMSTDDYNASLSQRRAEAVRAYLIGKGVAAERLSAKGYGEAQPVADNATEEGRAKNRRVELVPQQ